MMESNSREIEIKLLFKDKQEVLSKISPAPKFIKKISIYDVYYSKGNEMKNTNEFFRVREIDNKKVELTFKGKAKDNNNVWYRDEITTKISSVKEADKTLTKQGFKKVSEYKSEKEYYKSDGVEITFAKFIVPASLEFMEIEGESEEKIRDIVKGLGDSVKEAGEEIFRVFDERRDNESSCGNN